MGDDLGDDEFYLPASTFRADIDESAFDSVSGPTSAATSNKSKRRKDGSADGVEEDDGDDGMPAPAAPSSKKAKASAKPASAQSNSQLLLTASHTLPTAEVTLQSTYMAALMASCLPNSAVPPFPASMFVPCPSPFLSIPPNKHDDNLVSYLKATVFNASFDGGGGMKQLKRYITPPASSSSPSSSSSAKAPAPGLLLSPLLLVVTSGALRACEIAKSLAALHCRVGKLFSKNMSVSEQVSLLQSGSPPIVVGTPNRLRKIFYKQGGKDMKVGDGGINLASVRMVLIDMKPDEKGFTVITLNDTKKDLVELLIEQHGLFVGSGGAKLALY